MNARNQLLAQISWADQPEFLDRAKSVELTLGKTIYEAGAPMDYAYFPSRGTLSAVVVMSSGDTVEVATVGKEGVVGLTTLAGNGRSPHRVFVQVPGEALRIEAPLLQTRMLHDEALRQLLFRYHDAFLFQVSQSVACNALHQLLERCCRWLLMTHDRVEGNELSLTHEFLAIMLGVRRSSVTDALQVLRDQGLVNGSRGKITVLNRAGLEAGSCECYRAVRNEYARLLG